MTTRHPISSVLSARLTEFRLALILLTRIPAGKLKGDVPPVAATAWAFPLVGVLASLPGALIFWVSVGLLPPTIAGLLAVGAGLFVTGALHEDGLADLCDGLGGGRTREHRLEIMRDSRIGSYGTLALILAVALRVVALANIPDATVAALALVCFGGASRAGLPLIMLLQPPARSDGLGFSTGRPSPYAVVVSFGFGIALLLTAGVGALGIVAIATSVAVLCWYCAWKLGGYTGDTLGASQQIAELASWLAILSRA